MKIPIFFRNKKSLLCLLLFIVILVNTLPFAFCTNVVVDWTEEDVYKHPTYTIMQWMGFYESYYTEGSWQDSWLEIQDLDLHIEFDFDTMQFTGYLSGGTEKQIPNRYWLIDAFNGDISGDIKREIWGAEWYWELEGTASLTLHFIAKQPYTDESGQHWYTVDETIEVTADVWGDTLGATTFDILWEDEGGHDQGTRKFSISFDEDEGLVPPEWPYPVDIQLSLSGPEYVGLDQDGVSFDLEASGSELTLVEQVLWHFWYGDEDYYYHINAVEMSDLSSLRVSKEFMEEWVLDFEINSVSVDGVEQLPMMVEVILYSDTEQLDQLVAPVEYEFTFIDALVDPDTGQIVTQEETGTSEDSSGDTSGSDASDGVVASGENSLMSLKVIAPALGALALGGYGLSRMLRKPSKPLELDSEIRMEGTQDGSLGDVNISDDPKAVGIDVDDMSMDGNVRMVHSVNFDSDGTFSAESQTIIDSNAKPETYPDAAEEKVSKIADDVLDDPTLVASKEPIDDLDLTPEDLKLDVGDVGTSLESEKVIVEPEPSPKVDLDSINMETDVPSDTSTIVDKLDETTQGIRLEGSLDSEDTDVPEESDISVEDVKGNVRMVIDARMDDTGNFAASSKTVIDGEKRETDPKQKKSKQDQ